MPATVEADGSMAPQLHADVSAMAVAGGTDSYRNRSGANQGAAAGSVRHQLRQPRAQVGTGQRRVEEQHPHAVRRDLGAQAPADLDLLPAEAVAPGPRLQVSGHLQRACAVALVQQHQGGLRGVAVLVDAVERGGVAGQAQVELQAALQGWRLPAQGRDPLQRLEDRAGRRRIDPRLAEVGAVARVLDVAAGTGNVAIRAAEAGAQVVASDLTPESFVAGRREARSREVELEWVEADAEALPFADGSFDVVTSCFGAMFAPDHRKVADELVRVCRPGGTIGLASFTPESLLPAFFDVFAPYTPPPPADALPPVLWGSEEHVRGLFGERVSSLRLDRRVYVERVPDPAAYCELCKETFGPVVAVYESVADDPDAVAELDRRFLDFATRANAGLPGGQAEYPYEYLLAVARTAA